MSDALFKCGDVMRIRRFVGMEIDPKFFDLACARIADALARPDMFITKSARTKPPELQLDATGRP